MAQFGRGRDFAFSVPDDWVERSMIGYSAPPSPERPMAPNVLVSIVDVAADEDLGNFVTRQIEDLEHRVSGFNLALRRDAKLDGAPCVEIVFSWQSGDEPVKQRQIYVCRAGKRLVTITHTARERDFAAANPAFLEMLRDFSWREAEDRPGAVTD